MRIVLYNNIQIFQIDCCRLVCKITCSSITLSTTQTDKKKNKFNKTFLCESEVINVLIKKKKTNLIANESKFNFFYLRYKRFKNIVKLNSLYYSICISNG